MDLPSHSLASSTLQLAERLHNRSSITSRRAVSRWLLSHSRGRRCIASLSKRYVSLNRYPPLCVNLWK
jgi:hypothetical protein